MARITAVDNDSILLWVDPAAKLIGHELRKFVTAEVLRKAFETGLELTKKHAVTKWISDDRKGGALPPEHLQWSQSFWRPNMIKAGWKYWALLPPEKVVGQMSMKRVAEDYAKLGLTMRVFHEAEEALKWLAGV